MSLRSLLTTILAVLSLVACTHVQPWQRGKLAHPSMTGELNSASADHVYAVHEGATGGEATTESGCGCN